MAWRYLFSNRQRFVPILSAVALGGVALGVWSFILVLGVMRGFQGELNARWVGLNAHLTVTQIGAAPDHVAQNATLGQFKRNALTAPWRASTLNPAALDPAALDPAALDPAALKKIRGWPEVAEAVLFAEGEVIVQAEGIEGGEAVAAKVRGLEKIGPEFLKKVQIYPEEISDWDLASPNAPPNSTTLNAPPNATQILPHGSGEERTPNFQPNAASHSRPPLLGGHELMATLGLHPDSDDALTLIYPLGDIGPTGDFVPRQKTFRLANIFKTGLYEWDGLRMVVPLWTAEGLLGDQGEKGLLIWLHDLSDLDAVKKELQKIFPESAKIETFAEQNKRLFAALKLERLAMTFFLILFGLIASFSITGLLLLYVDSKKRDLGILKACGLSPSQAGKIFLSLGGLIGGIGAVCGGILGIATSLVLKWHPIPLPSTYYLDTLPVQLEPAGVAAILICGFLLALISSLYPVWVASKMDVLSILREE